MCYCRCHKSSRCLHRQCNSSAHRCLVGCNLFFSTGKNKECPVHNHLSSLQYVWVSWPTGGHIQGLQLYTFRYYQPQVVWCAWYPGTTFITSWPGELGYTDREGVNHLEPNTDYFLLRMIARTVHAVLWLTTGLMTGLGLQTGGGVICLPSCLHQLWGPSNIQSNRHQI